MKKHARKNGFSTLRHGRKNEPSHHDQLLTWDNNKTTIKQKYLLPQKAFTLVELLVVIAIIGVLVSLLLPAVQAAREAARRSNCKNNLKQIALAMLNYESSYGHLPAGILESDQAVDGIGWGTSWWMRTLPFIEQGNLHDLFDHDSQHTGWTGGGVGNAENRALLRNLDVPFMHCPSSDLPKLVPAGNFDDEGIMSATYTGVSGSADLNREHARNNSGSGAPGIISFGGALIAQKPIELRQITDGLTNTMMIAEQSDWCINQNGELKDCRSDCKHGFPMGWNNDGWERKFNLTCVRHRINEKTFEADGVQGNCGPNRAIQSAHPGGAFVSMADGSVQFLNESIELVDLWNLADRDDGNLINIEL